MPILRAAIELENGAIIALGDKDRHHDLIRFHATCELKFYKMTRQGFLFESTGLCNAGSLMFMDRKMAYTYAKANGQIIRPNAPDEGTLYTEDLF